MSSKEARRHTQDVGGNRVTPPNAALRYTRPIAAAVTVSKQFRGVLRSLPGWWSKFGHTKWPFDTCVGRARRLKRFQPHEIPCTKTLYNLLWRGELLLSLFERSAVDSTENPTFLSAQTAKASTSDRLKWTSAAPLVIGNPIP